MASVWAELKRRNVVKVAVAYAIVAWLLMQVVSTFFPALSLPAWTISFVAALLIIGFPVALLLAWAFELTPEGVKPTRKVEESASITHITGRKIDFAIIGALVLTLGFVVYNYVLVEPDTIVEVPSAPSVESANPEPESVSPVVVEEARGVLPNSVAVLPLENLSLDPENAFFAAGIHEEILNQLVKLSNLNVISRTSMVRYAKSDLTIPEIASELNVGAVMEGSVRYADDRVLVTLQLIDPETDAHLWSESYNREFSDVFAMQADIAMNIANAIGAEFSLEEQASIEAVPTNSPEAYRYYLAALDLNDTSELDQKIEYLSLAIEADPEFAEAYVLRGWMHALSAGQDAGSQAEFETIVAEKERLAYADIHKALGLNPGLASAYAAEGWIHRTNWQGTQALEAYERAHEISPNDTVVLDFYSDFLSSIGNHKEAVRLAERRYELDPNNIGRLGDIFWNSGDIERSVAIYLEQLKTSPRNAAANRQLAIYEFENGDFLKAKTYLDILMPAAMGANNLGRIASVARLYAQMGFQEDAETLLGVFEERSATRRVTATARAVEHLARGDEEQALLWLERAAELKQPYQSIRLVLSIKHNSLHSPVLDKSEFVAVREKLGFTDL